MHLNLKLSSYYRSSLCCLNGVTGDFPLETTSSVDRLHQTDTILKHISADVGLSANSNAVVSLGLFPTAIASRIFSSVYKFGPSYLISTLPTTTTAEYNNDGEIVDVFYIAVPEGDLGMNVCAWGVNNQQRFSFLVDKNVLGDASNIGQAFTEELKLLATAKL
ncbi:unnamed protein product [Allacma fusca]|uniref:O-acyltransferase WSD1 C-terminal domain-containing protein n=1 Tax=Allacma fusca TaxID=39272 RepID=A0A8J2LCP4_9HEXA|nr:unnamed protein product [Allacma fusca]